MKAPKSSFCGEVCLGGESLKVLLKKSNPIPDVVACSVFTTSFGIVSLDAVSDLNNPNISFDCNFCVSGASGLLSLLF